MCAALACLQGGCGDSSTLRCSPASDRPNVLLYVVDTLRADAVGSYGSEVETPAIDQLSREGKLFTNAFAPS
jgi:arylsulfatase A-like enzyme